MHGMHFLLAAEALDVIYINVWSILISLINLLILFVILKKLLFKPVVKVVSARQAKVDNLLGDAEAAKAAAEADKALYGEKLSRADADAAEVIRRATQSANRTGEEIIGDAQKRAGDLMRRADEDIAQQKKKALNDIKAEVSDLSLAIAEKVVSREISEADHRKLIDDFIGEVGESHE